MKAMTMLMTAATLALGCLSTASLESQVVRTAAREENPPVLFLRIGDRLATGTGELRVAPDAERLKLRTDGKTRDLLLLTDKQQHVEIRSGALLSGAAGVVKRLGIESSTQPALRLLYEQRLDEDGRRFFLAIRPLNDKDPALLVHLDLGGEEPIQKEILPGLTLSQKDEPPGTPDVNGGAARRTWLTVDVQGAGPEVTLEGGDTRTITYRGAPYLLHVYRSLRRDPGTNPRLPFEGEKYLLTATLTPQ